MLVPTAQPLGMLAAYLLEFFRFADDTTARQGVKLFPDTPLAARKHATKKTEAVSTHSARARSRAGLPTPPRTHRSLVCSPNPHPAGEADIMWPPQTES